MRHRQYLCTFATAVCLRCICAPLPQLCFCIAFVHLCHSCVLALHSCTFSTAVFLHHIHVVLIRIVYTHIVATVICAWMVFSVCLSFICWHLLAFSVWLGSICIQEMFPLSAHMFHACFQQMLPQSCTHVPYMLSTDVPPFLHTCFTHAFNRCSPLSAHIFHACF